MSSNSDNAGARIVTAMQVEMRRAIKTLGDSSWSREQMYDRAARAAQITPRMAKALFNWEPSASGSDRHFSSVVIERVRAAVRKKLHEQEIAARDEYRAITQRIAVIEARLRQIDPDFFSPDADGLGEQLRRSGRQDRAVD